MMPLSVWVAPAAEGLLFTTLGLTKIYGFRKGIVGGPGKSASCRLLGYCPSWGRPLNWTLALFCLAVGLYRLTDALRLALSS